MIMEEEGNSSLSISDLGHRSAARVAGGGGAAAANIPPAAAPAAGGDGDTHRRRDEEPASSSSDDRCDDSSYGTAEEHAQDSGGSDHHRRHDATAEATASSSVPPLPPVRPTYAGTAASLEAAAVNGDPGSGSGPAAATNGHGGGGGNDDSEEGPIIGGPPRALYSRRFIERKKSEGSLDRALALAETAEREEAAELADKMLHNGNDNASPAPAQQRERDTHWEMGTYDDTAGERSNKSAAGQDRDPAAAAGSLNSSPNSSGAGRNGNGGSGGNGNGTSTNGGSFSSKHRGRAWYTPVPPPPGTDLHDYKESQRNMEAGDATSENRRAGLAPQQSVRYDPTAGGGTGAGGGAMGGLSEADIDDVIAEVETGLGQGPGAAGASHNANANNDNDTGRPNYFWSGASRAGNVSAPLPGESPDWAMDSEDARWRIRLRQKAQPVLCAALLAWAAILAGVVIFGETNNNGGGGVAPGTLGVAGTASPESTAAAGEGSEGVVLDLPPAPSHLIGTCSHASLSTPDGYASCSAACVDAVDCCDVPDLVCRAQDPSVCAGYVPCESLFMVEPPSDSSSHGSGAVGGSGPSSASDVWDACSSKSVRTATGYDACSRYCTGPLACCGTTGGVGGASSCYPNDVAMCRSYVACNALITLPRLPSADNEAADNSAAAADDDKVDGSAKSEAAADSTHDEKKDDSASAEGPDDDGDATGGNKREVVPPAPSDLRTACVASRLETDRGFEECEDACRPAKCCLEPADRCQVSNPEVCNDYRYCAGLYEVMAEEAREGFHVTDEGGGDGGSEKGSEEGASQEVQEVVTALTTTTTSAAAVTTAVAEKETEDPSAQTKVSDDDNGHDRGNGDDDDDDRNKDAVNLPDPPSDLEQLCDPDKVLSDVRAFVKCETACSPAFCCWTPVLADSCAGGRRGDDEGITCRKYEACEVLEKGGQRRYRRSR